MSLRACLKPGAHGLVSTLMSSSENDVDRVSKHSGGVTLSALTFEEFHNAFSQNGFKFENIFSPDGYMINAHVVSI